MTAPKHDCAATREQLLDLLYDELDAAESATLWAAAEACPGCAAELAKLEHGLSLAAALPLEEPSAGFDQRLMARAHQQLAEATSETTPAPPSLGVVPTLVRRLRDLLAGPQVAMATLTLLVAALGLWYLPSRRAPVGAAGDTVVALEPDGEEIATAPSSAAPSIAEEPAPTGASTPQAQAVVGRSRSARSASNSRQREASEAPFGGGARDRNRGRGSVARGNAMSDAPSVGLESHPDRELRQAAPARSTTMTARPRSFASARPARRHRSRGAAPSMSSAAAGTQSMDDLLDDASPEVTAAAGLGGAPPRPAVGDRQTYERGLSRYRARDYRGAIAELERVVQAPSPDARSLVPSALHHIAQSLRARGSCGPALSRYESLLRRFPSYSQAPRAMMEAADCYRRQGQLSAARRWATRAQGYAATAAAARRELLRLDSMESGSSRRRPARQSRDAPSAAAVEEAY